MQGAGGGILDDNAVGHGVTERNSDFNHADSVSFEGTDNVGCTVEGGTACTKVNGQQILGAVLESWLMRFNILFLFTILQFTIYYLAAQYMLHGTIYNFTIYYLLFTMYNLPCGVYCAAK